MIWSAGKETSRVASLLFKRAQEAERRYLALPMSEIRERVANDFPEELRWSTDDQVTFHYLDLPDFSLSILSNLQDNLLTVLAGGAFQGFMLQRAGNSWHVSTSKPLAGPLGSQATKLCDIFENQFGVPNFAKKIERALQVTSGAWASSPSERPDFRPSTSSSLTLGESRLEPWLDRSGHPWRRYLARLFDININGSVVLFPLVYLVGTLDSGIALQLLQFMEGVLGYIAFGLLNVLTGFLVNTLLIGSTGSTVGKWIYGVRVTRADRKRIGFRLALKREFFVLVRGIALGIPLLNLFAMLNCYNYLAEHSTTRWDERCATQVSHRPNTPGQALARFLATIVLILVVVASNARA